MRRVRSMGRDVVWWIRVQKNRVFSQGGGPPTSASTMHAVYKLPGCRSFDDNPVYRTPDACPDFQQRFEAFKACIDALVAGRAGASILHFGDGDYYFLKGIATGSATPGKRALSLEYRQIPLERFREGLGACDYVAVELLPSVRRNFAEIQPNRAIDFELEFIYGLVASRWLTKRYAGRVGLIGAAPKLALIKELLKHSAYRRYLGLDSFVDYVEVPQKFAADDLDGLRASLRSQLEHSQSELFLVGMGSAKLGVVHDLPKHHPAVYLDVGCGIDALAGIVDPWRPYFADWINFQLEDVGAYSEIDFLQVGEFRNRIFLPASEHEARYISDDLDLRPT